MRVLALIVAAGALTSGALAAAQKPHLRLERTDPLVVAGSHFRGHERVKPVVHAARMTVFHVRARHGSFIARLGDVPLPHCATARVVAVGSRGSRATLRLPRPACPPPALVGG